MNILESIVGNKMVMRVATNKICEYMGRENISCIIIQSNPGDQENPLDIKSYNQTIGIIGGEALDEYRDYLAAKALGWEAMLAFMAKVSPEDEAIANETVPNILGEDDKKEAGHV